MGSESPSHLPRSSVWPSVAMSVSPWPQRCSTHERAKNTEPTTGSRSLPSKETRSSQQTRHQLSPRRSKEQHKGQQEFTGCEVTPKQSGQTSRGSEVVDESPSTFGAPGHSSLTYSTRARQGDKGIGKGDKGKNADTSYVVFPLFTRGQQQSSGDSTMGQIFCWDYQGERCNGGCNSTHVCAGIGERVPEVPLHAPLI